MTTALEPLVVKPGAGRPKYMCARRDRRANVWVGKRQHVTVDSALAHIAELKARARYSDRHDPDRHDPARLTYYRCRVCGFIHVGHVPQEQ